MRLNLFQQYNNLLPVILVLSSLVLLLGSTTHALYFRLDTDYNVAIPMADFAIRAYRDPSHFLAWNSFIGLGVPVLGDPSSLVFSPWFMPWFLLFGAVVGLRIIIAITILCSGVTMWFLLNSLFIDRRISQWGAILYGTSGALAAVIASGHIEKFPTYVLAPVIFALFFRSQFRFRIAGLIGLLYATIFFSVDFYGIWFFSIFWLIFRLYDVVTRKRTVSTFILEGFSIYGTFAIFILPKLLPFVRDVLPYFTRLSYINPYEGSIHALFLPLPYIVPWQVMFYDRPTLQRIIRFHYNWYEYYAFITPIALLPLFFVRRVMSRPLVIYLLLSMLVGAAYISLQYPYSPFYWIFHVFAFARSFRVPQRVVVPLLVPLIILISYCLDMLLKQYKGLYRNLLMGICIISIIWTYSMSFTTIRTAFAPNRVAEESIARELRQADGGNFYVANFACCMQPYLLAQSIPILNYYYGWTPLYAPTFKNQKGDAYDFSVFTYMKPTYIIAESTHDFSTYGYEVFLVKGTVRVWKTNAPTIFPNL